MTSSSDLEVGPTSTEDALVSALWAVAERRWVCTAKQAYWTAVARKHGWTPEQFAARIERGLR